MQPMNLKKLLKMQHRQSLEILLKLKSHPVNKKNNRNSRAINSYNRKFLNFRVYQLTALLNKMNYLINLLKMD